MFNIVIENIFKVLLSVLLVLKMFSENIFKVLLTVLLVSILVLGYTAYIEVTTSLNEIQQYLDAIYNEQSTEYMDIGDQLRRLIELYIADQGNHFPNKF